MKKNLSVLKKISTLGVLAVFMIGCETYDYTGPSERDAGIRSGQDGVAEGSAIAGQLRRADRQALEEVFQTALNSPDIGRSRSWQNGQTSGEIQAGQHFIANILADPDLLIPAKQGLDLGFRLETEQGEHVLTKNSNIRFGPSTNHEIVQTLPSGTGVRGLGRVVLLTSNTSAQSSNPGERWMLISVDAIAIGYVFEPLLVKAPGTSSLELAGGPIKQPVACREFSQNLTIGKQRDRWQGIACRFGDQWEVAPRGGPSVLGQG